MSKSRKLSAIMFTDIVGYTALMQQDEAIAAKIRSRHREVFMQQHAHYQGEVIQYYGDGTLSIFGSAVEAVECAISIQLLLNGGDHVVPLRIGLHLGDIVHSESDVYGDGVNVASRIENLGVAGAILLSEKINDELKNQKHITTRSLGIFELKNVSSPLEIFAVANHGIHFPDAMQGLPASQPISQRIVPNQTKSIAVIPLVNMSSNKENEYFSDGMTEEIINALTRIKELKVTSRTSSFYFKNKDIPIRQIGQELNVSTILEGSIRLAGNKMRITVQLIDVASDSHFWSETFDRSLEDVFTVQDEISKLIADKLRVHLGHFDVGEQLVVAPDIDVESYQQYLKSRYHLLKMNKPDIEMGLSILQKVINDNPQFALAYVAMHLGYALLGTLGLMPAGEAFIKGQVYLDKAIELDPDLPECQLNLAWISFLQGWDAKQAYRHLQKVFEIRPVAEYYQAMASILIAEGKPEAALYYLQTAIEIDPFSEISYHLKGFALYTQEKYAEAIMQFEKSVSLKPDSLVAFLYWCQALILEGRAHEALIFSENFSDKKDPLLKLGGITLSHAALGNHEKANEGIASLEVALHGESMDRALNILILCKTVIGDSEGAIDLIEKGILNRLPMMVYLDVDPILKPLRANERFGKLIAQVLR